MLHPDSNWGRDDDAATRFRILVGGWLGTVCLACSLRYVLGAQQSNWSAFVFNRHMGRNVKKFLTLLARNRVPGWFPRVGIAGTFSGGFDVPRGMWDIRDLPGKK